MELLAGIGCDELPVGRHCSLVSPLDSEGTKVSEFVDTLDSFGKRYPSEG